jgi:hypothetical protein
VVGIANTAGRKWLEQLAGSDWHSWQGVAGTAGRFTKKTVYLAEEVMGELEFLKEGGTVPGA